MKTASKTSAAEPTVIMARPPLTDEDFDFSSDRVPDLELMPCLLIEFLRESSTARQLELDFIEASAIATRLQQKMIDKLYARLAEIRININHKLDVPGFVERAVVSTEQFMGLLQKSWQNLHPEVKQILTLRCTEVEKAAFITTDELHTYELFKAMRLAELLYMKAFESDKQLLPTADARAPLDFLDGETGRMIFGVVADFSRYDDNAIRAALANVAEEIIKSRPKNTKPQVRKESGQGRNAEWRGILNSLGLARLYAHYTAQELKSKMPKIYDRIAKPLKDKGTTAVQKKLDSARVRFVARFHEILPFEKLPPLCLRQSRIVK
jgi:hypothetical protein